jgi:tetratricopeptide (TPR) repeat protein
MQAIVSGQAGLAVLIDGESVYSIEANDPGVDTPRDRTELLHLFAGATDVVEFPVEDRAAAVRRLEFDWNCDRALRMTLILLDPEEDSETRVLAAECVENRLSDQAVRNWLVARLYQAVMPESGDLAGSIDLTSSDELPLIQKLLIELQADQPHIQAAVEAWDEVAVPTGGNSLNKPELFDRLIASGACYQVARAAAGGKASSATFDVLGHPGIKSLPGIGPVISSWIKILSATPEPVSKEQPVDKKAAKKQRKVKARQSRKPAAEDSAGGTGHEEFQRWEREFESIVAQIDGDKLSNARKFLGELIQRQIAEGNRELAGKTASKLATEMKVRSRTALQLEFARLAVEVNSEDPQVHNHLAEALREVGETSEAISVYRETAALFPQDVVCRCGLAEALRDSGELPEALSIYRETAACFPQNVVCRNGLAEALREVGETSEAIKVYRETAARFPQDVVCRGGLAVMLAEDSKFDEALELLPEKSPKTHQELIGWHIRGMVYLQKKDTAAAVATFKIGLERALQERDKAYYRHALAGAYLRTGQHREAVDLLEGASDELSDLFRAHALGELEDRELVKQALDRLRGTTRPEVQELRNEFEEVYVQNDPQSRRSSADWLDHVFQREFELLRDATRSMHRQSAV